MCCKSTIICERIKYDEALFILGSAYKELFVCIAFHAVKSFPEKNIPLTKGCVQKKKKSDGGDGPWNQSSCLSVEVRKFPWPKWRRLDFALQDLINHRHLSSLYAASQQALAAAKTGSINLPVTRSPC